MAHVLLLSLNFPPDGVSTAHLYGDLTEDLVANGHIVTVLTTLPHSNRDHVAEAAQPITPILGSLVGKSTYRGATVYHTFALRKTASRAKRVLAWAIYHLIATMLGWALKIRPDVVLAPSPPLTMGLGAWLVAVRHRAPVIYTVQELYPDVAIDMGLLSNPLAVRLAYRLESFIYRQSTRVTAITPGIRDAILSKGVPNEKVQYIPNWVDTDEFRPSARVNAFARKHGINGKFVVSYAGNMGFAQSFAELIGAAKRLQDHDGIRFLLVGGGVEQDRIRRETQDLPNVVVLPHQPYETMPEIYAASDLCYVPLLDGLGAAAMPSKVYKVMASGRAVLALTSSQSDLGVLVQEARCGLVIEPGSADKLASSIVEASQDEEKLKAYGLAARRFVEDRYSRSSVMREYESLISALIAPHPSSAGI